MADTPLEVAGREDKTEPQITVTGVLVNALKSAVADVQDTADRELTCDPFGLGVGWTAQLFPFHASTRVASRPVLL